LKSYQETYKIDEQTIATKPSISRFDLRRVICSGWLNRVVIRRTGFSSTTNDIQD